MRANIPWHTEAKLHRGPDRIPSPCDQQKRMRAGGMLRGPVLKLVGVVARMPWKQRPLYAMHLPDGRCIYGPEISALAEREDFPEDIHASPGGENLNAIPWGSQAHFTDIDGDYSFTGTLTECVRAFGELPEERRCGALITTDELIEAPDQPAPSSNLEHGTLAWLLAQLTEKGG
jgi:hypothetical protein